MTLRLAAFQHFCARFADAVLTSWSPLTYERGDYMDGTEKLDPDWEPGCDGKCAHDECVCDALTALRDRLAFLASPDSPVGVSTSPPTVPPTGLDPSPTIIESAPPPPVGGDGPSEEIAAFPRRPSEGHPTVPAGSAPDLPAGISLPMFRASDLIAIAVSYGMDHTYTESVISIGTPYCSCGPVMATYLDWWKHVAEIQVSAITAELTALAWDQSHPQIPQEQP